MSISDYREAVRKGAHCKIGLPLASGVPAITILPVGGVSGAVFSIEELLTDWKALCEQVHKQRENSVEKLQSQQREIQVLRNKVIRESDRADKAVVENMCPACQGPGGE